jgi:transcriptional/translational regulatory protein YebC/TACO1
MAEPGAVAWQFDRKGTVVVDGGADEDELMMAALDGGAEDVERVGDTWAVSTAPTDLHTVRSAVEEAGFTVASGDLTMVAQNLVPLEDKGSAKKVLDLIDALEDLDDVQDVYGNFDIPDEVLAELE